MQTGGQVSSAPGRRGSQTGRECLAPEGSPRLAPTRASSASSSSYILREVTRFPLPPDRRTCFSAQRGPRPQVPPPRSHTPKWATCHRCRRAPSAQTLRQRVLAQCKTGGSSGRKKGFCKSRLLQQRTPIPPLKTPGQASSCSQATVTHAVLPSERPRTHKGQHTSACDQSGSVRICLERGTRLSPPEGGN